MQKLVKKYKSMNLKAKKTTILILMETSEKTHGMKLGNPTFVINFYYVNQSNVC